MLANQKANDNPAVFANNILLTSLLFMDFISFLFFIIHSDEFQVI